MVSHDDEEHPPHPEDYRREDGTTDYRAWQAALDAWHLPPRDVEDTKRKEGDLH